MSFAEQLSVSCCLCRGNAEVNANFEKKEVVSYVQARQEDNPSV